jgi:hypothetical protein
MSLLAGDTTADGFVDSADISQTKSQSGNPVTAANFREDVNGNGLIDSADIALVKSKLGTALTTTATRSVIGAPTLQTTKVPKMERSR